MNEKRKLYRFSPITSEQAMLEAVEYIAIEATRMLFREMGTNQQIKHVTIFAHYWDEYNELVQLTSQLGTQTEANNGIRTRLTKNIDVFTMKLETNSGVIDVTESIESIRIRKPDPYRMQVGCCDFEYDGEYLWLATTETVGRANMRRIERDDIDMVEFSDPDIDVLAYVVNR